MAAESTALLDGARLQSLCVKKSQKPRFTGTADRPVMSPLPSTTNHLMYLRRIRVLLAASKFRVFSNQYQKEKLLLALMQIRAFPGELKRRPTALHWRLEMRNTCLPTTSLSSRKWRRASAAQIADTDATYSRTSLFRN